MKDFIAFLAQSLVDNPDKIEVMELGEGRTRVIELKVAQEDFGRIIGRKGRTVNAIRTLLDAASIKMKKNIVLEVIE
ncbi:MAG: RNA-binding protein [Candidatus Schekmanbacteria bacterium RIFCSPHIGHO2_02_FULL_38_11]|uniref:RNA-binding protein KhpA n=1 Tax=Candidatus Schekmanbacteria bacterium RIFCSPLOWO2_12_FULL_38_15 TaxID=1817883 RepID=A0A1F7SMY0_9BACT|nr:MAG: RNA-binding protein [Candidatus Schekmanbacteria bacterium GWA2_38_9]OGL50018.1 MAG: RNA-binding protein [Candidatus Schekmanbacteria bacterium RIFCSPHIGHO2_02_FULL_38_11]OGL51133.1 MAG: RNA-binding protein [Candidatus Schekmanbacteria bacterium RIFCSPLOWO2_02_FULL_38_14]OGL55133.1 MAG: RNA-binding protein [Candidatus Schekmanbacteria bacterium RIFCSPLOWO2_12_FULL_38_15]